MRFFGRFYPELVRISPYLLVLGVFVLAVSPGLCSEGMFMDGLIYSSLAHNLSQGIGSFWHLSFSETVMRDFSGHPPLAIFLQSWMYIGLGEAYWVDKVYSFLLILVQAILVHRVWKEIWRIKMPMHQIPSLVALSFFLLSPLVVWAATNNLLENTLSVFVLASVWCYFRYKRIEASYRYLYLTLSGLLLMLGFLCKSFVGLFVWGLPLAWALSDLFKGGEFRKMNARSILTLLRDTLLLISFTVLPLWALYLLDDQARLFAHRYWAEQIVGSFDAGVSGSRWYLLVRFFWESLPVWIVFFALRVWMRKRQTKMPEATPVAVLFLLLFVFGTLPLLISLKQRTFYLLTAWPYLALGLAAWIKVSELRSSSRFIPISLGCLFLAVGSCCYFSHRPPRQKELLNDIHVILREVPPGSRVRISPRMTQEWSLYGYMARYAQISLEHRADRSCRFLLLDKNLPENRDKEWLKGYTQVPVQLHQYRLYRFTSQKKDTSSVFL